MLKLERDKGSPPVMFKPWGCWRRQVCGALIVGVRDVDGPDVGGGVDSSTLMSSLYTHPLGSVGRQKCNGIFVIFLDKSGQSIDQSCHFRTVEVNVDHASGL